MEIYSLYVQLADEDCHLVNLLLAVRVKKSWISYVVQINAMSVCNTHSRNSSKLKLWDEKSRNKAHETKHSRQIHLIDCQCLSGFQWMQNQNFCDSINLHVFRWNSSLELLKLHRNNFWFSSILIKNPSNCIFPLIYSWLSMILKTTSSRRTSLRMLKKWPRNIWFPSKRSSAL